MNVRNAKHLEERYSTHPLKGDIAAALAAAENFAERASAIKVDKNLSAEGRVNAIRGHLKSALRDIRDSAAPIESMKTKLAGIQASIKSPPVDKTDVAGALARQELRAALRGMPIGDKASLLVGDHADTAFVDAALEQPAVLSGVPKELFEQAKLQRFEQLFKSEIGEGERLDQHIAEGESGLELARGDLARASGFTEHEFEKLVIEVNSGKNSVWLRRETDISGNEIVAVVPLKGGASRPATPAEVRDGRFFESFEAFKASRAA
jgi:hypothetical protein